jgi:hypothetical protein
MLGKTLSLNLMTRQLLTLNILKVNFDVAMKSSFAVVAAMVSNNQCDIIAAYAKRLPQQDASSSEAQAALLAMNITVSHG